MSNQIFLSRFTPSLMPPEVLEQIFVQRGDLAEHLVSIVRDSVLTPAKHHTLVLGPRGIGKTHLLSLVNHRTAAQEDLHDRMRIAWLREEEWGVSSFLDLLHRILRALAETYQDNDLTAQTEKLFSLSTRVAERRAGDLLRSFLDGRTLVLMTENLDDIFSGLGKKEQHRFRAYLQEEESWTIVATAQRLFSGVSLHESPFYGFFEVHHLQELSVADAALLVMNIAKLKNDEELATFVQTGEGRARIKAIHHLAGGNHRVYVILSEFLTREKLDELVDPFLKAMDDLTPYYQARMAQLSAQQRKVIDFLCDARGAVPVKQIAQRCFMSPQTASSQLKDLRDKGYVRSTPIGRDSYYELTEPLMRIALEVKKQREGPVRLFLDFLRHWYSPDELIEQLAHVQTHSLLERDYLQRVLQDRSNSTGDSGIAECITNFEQQMATENFAVALSTAEHLVELRSDATNWALLGRCLVTLGRFEAALNASNRALVADPSHLAARFVRITALVGMGQAQEALQVVERMLAIGGEDEEENAVLHLLRSAVLVRLERNSEARESLHQFVQRVPDSPENWRERGVLLQLVGCYEEAAETFERMINRGSMEPQDWGTYGQILEKLERYEDSVASFDRQLACVPETYDSWVGRGDLTP
jgi:tetratricopeptide (TPR) repeat protein